MHTDHKIVHVCQIEIFLLQTMLHTALIKLLSHVTQHCVIDTTYSVTLSFAYTKF